MEACGVLTETTAPDRMRAGRRASEDRAKPGPAEIPRLPSPLDDLDVDGLDAIPPLGACAPAGAPDRDHARPLKVVGALWARVHEDAPAV